MHSRAAPCARAASSSWRLQEIRDLTTCGGRARMPGVKSEKTSQIVQTLPAHPDGESLVRALVEAGYSNTRPRQVISEVIASATEGLTALQILTRGQRQHARLGLGTVYRTLDILMNLNLVRRVHRAGGCRGYLPASAGHHHVLICEGCGRAVEFPGGDDLSWLVEQVEAITGYKVDDHLLQLFGRCPGCEQAEL